MAILFAGNDVSEREELRETLSRNVAQLESIFDVIPDSVRVFDTEGRTVRSNTQALQDHPSGQPSTLRELWQLDRPRTIDGTSLFMHEHPTARALRGERVRGETLAVRRGVDGSPVIIEVNSNPLYDEHGKIRGAVTVERDVTVKTQLAKALEEEARRTAELYERVSTEAERLERMVQERTPSCSRCRRRARASAGSPRSASSPRASCTTSTTRSIRSWPRRTCSRRTPRIRPRCATTRCASPRPPKPARRRRRASAGSFARSRCRRSARSWSTSRSCATKSSR